MESRGSNLAQFLGCALFYVLVGKLVLVWSKSRVHLRYYNNESTTQGQIRHKEMPILSKGLQHSTKISTLIALGYSVQMVSTCRKLLISFSDDERVRVFAYKDAKKNTVCNDGTFSF